MKIAFIGDSYCANVYHGGYPGIVLKHFNAKLVSQGQGGQCLFYTYEQLVSVINKTDFIVLCITDPYRLPNSNNLPITSGNWRNFQDSRTSMWTRRQQWTATGTQTSKEILEEFKKAVQGYYDLLINFKFHEVAQKGILMQMDELLLEHEKKCIWFPCFEDSMQGYIPKSGFILDTCLFEISCSEFASRKEAYQHIGNNYPDHINHFNKENNQNMANLIIDVITNYDQFNLNGVITPFNKLNEIIKIYKYSL